MEFLKHIPIVLFLHVSCLPVCTCAPCVCRAAVASSPYRRKVFILNTVLGILLLLMLLTWVEGCA